jgi:hypothetical protein
MHGIKLLGIYALAANKGDVEQQSVGMKSVGTPMTAEPAFGRRQALQSIFVAAAVVVASPGISLALDMDAFMNSEVRKSLVFSQQHLAQQYCTRN